MRSVKRNSALDNPVHCKTFITLLAGAGVVFISSQAQAVTINAIFDSSITNLSNAATVEAAFNTAAAAYTSVFNNPVTVNVRVGWGEVGGQAMGSDSAGASQTAVTGFWSYAQMRTLLAPYVSLPATQTGPTYFAMARAEAKALGLIAATSTISDGSIGFNSFLPYDFNQADGISPGTYDFVGLAEHEIAEVLGRNSSLTSIAPNNLYEMPVDLFRYSAPGVQSYSNNGAAYFSLDAGKTNFGWWNNSGADADRGDWLTGGVGSYPNDVQNAYLYPGATSLSPADLALLGALGWARTAKDSLPTTVAEPTALIMMAVGLAGLALVRRLRFSPQHMTKPIV